MQLADELTLKDEQFEEKSVLMSNFEAHKSQTNEDLNLLKEEILNRLGELKTGQKTCPDHLENLKQIQTAIQNLHSGMNDLKEEHQKTVVDKEAILETMKSQIIQLETVNKELKISVSRTSAPPSARKIQVESRPTQNAMNVGSVKRNVVYESRPVQKVGKVEPIKRNVVYQSRPITPIVYRTETHIVGSFISMDLV